MHADITVLHSDITELSWYNTERESRLYDSELHTFPLLPPPQAGDAAARLARRYIQPLLSLAFMVYGLFRTRGRATLPPRSI